MQRLAALLSQRVRRGQGQTLPSTVLFQAAPEDRACFLELPYAGPSTSSHAKLRKQLVFSTLPQLGNYPQHGAVPDEASPRMHGKCTPLHSVCLQHPPLGVCHRVQPLPAVQALLQSFKDQAILILLGGISAGIVAAAAPIARPDRHAGDLVLATARGPILQICHQLSLVAVQFRQLHPSSFRCPVEWVRCMAGMLAQFALPIVSCTISYEALPLFRMLSTCDKDTADKLALQHFWTASGARQAAVILQ